MDAGIAFMKLTLESFGGLAAGIRRPPKVVDTDSLSPEEAATATQLVAAAKTAPSSKTQNSNARDAVGYVITIEDAGDKQELEASDLNLSDSFVALRNYIQQHAD